MSPEVKQRRLETMSAYLADLEKFRNVTFVQYEEHHYAVKYLLLLLVQSAVDLLSHLLAERGVMQPDSYRGVCEEAARVGLIDQSLAESLVGAVGMRNMIVHEYMKVDEHLVWQAIPVALRDFTAFLSAMKAHIPQPK